MLHNERREHDIQLEWPPFTNSMLAIWALVTLSSWVKFALVLLVSPMVALLLCEFRTGSFFCSPIAVDQLGIMGIRKTACPKCFRIMHRLNSIKNSCNRSNKQLRHTTLSRPKLLIPNGQTRCNANQTFSTLWAKAFDSKQTTTGVMTTMFTYLQERYSNTSCKTA